MPQYGYQAPRMAFDSTIQIPTFCGVPTLKSVQFVTKKGAIAFDSCNNRFYTYNPKTLTWSQVSGGGGSTDTTSLSSRINLKLDSLKRRADSVFGYRNGTEVFQFKDSVGTNPPPNGYYGAFQDNTTQTAASANTATAVKFNTTDLSNGISVVNDGSGNPTRVTIANAGVYNIQFSLQLEKISGSGNYVIDIWLRKNGTNVEGTTGKIVLTGSANASPVVAAWNYVLQLASNDYVQLMWSTSNTNAVIISESGSTPYPSVPSSILTITQQSGIMAGTGISPLDTANMLNPYFRKSDTTSFLSTFQNVLTRSSTLTTNNTITASNIFRINSNGIGTTRASFLNIDSNQINSSVTNSTGVVSKMNLQSNSALLDVNTSGGGNTNVVLNSTSAKLQYVDQTSVPFPRRYVQVDNNGIGFYHGSSPVGYTFPITQGTSGQVLKLSSASQLEWRNDSVGITDTTTLQQKSLPSYSIMGNGTSTQANAQSIYYKDTSGTYSPTITWNGTAPTSLTNQYRWTRIGNKVDLYITLVYGTAGTGNSSLLFTLPTDIPTPFAPSGLTSNSNYLYPAIAMINTSTTALTSQGIRGGIRKNSGGTGYEINLNFTSAGMSVVIVSVTYYTN
jgi:hypothetical protein